MFVVGLSTTTTKQKQNVTDSQQSFLHTLYASTPEIRQHEIACCTNCVCATIANRMCCVCWLLIVICLWLCQRRRGFAVVVVVVGVDFVSFSGVTSNLYLHAQHLRTHTHTWTSNWATEPYIIFAYEITTKHKRANSHFGVHSVYQKHTAAAAAASVVRACVIASRKSSSFISES